MFDSFQINARPSPRLAAAVGIAPTPPAGNTITDQAGETITDQAGETLEAQ